jgi:hypothetical protein
LERRRRGRGGGGGGGRRPGLQLPEEAGRWEASAEKHRRAEVSPPGRLVWGRPPESSRRRGVSQLCLLFAPLLTKEQGVFPIYASTTFFFFFWNAPLWLLRFFFLPSKHAVRCNGRKKSHASNTVSKTQDPFFSFLRQKTQDPFTGPNYLFQHSVLTALLLMFLPAFTDHGRGVYMLALRPNMVNSNMMISTTHVIEHPVASACLIVLKLISSRWM